MYNLLDAINNPVERQNFWESFDLVLCDVDGVIVMMAEKLPDSETAIEMIRSQSKTIRFVSNNSTKTHKNYVDQFQNLGIKVNVNDIITPTTAIIHYLKSINFQRQVFVIGTKNMRQEMQEAGIKIAPDSPNYIEEVVENLIQNTADDEKVGAVVCDYDLNLNFIKLQKALVYLNRPDVLFIAGAKDAKLIVSPNLTLIGPKYFCETLEELSGRTPLQLAKPSLALNTFICNKYEQEMRNIPADRILFIGDSVSEDMAFASNCGYKKLLVLTGVTKGHNLTNWTWPNEYKPDYYIDSLGSLIKIHP